MADVGDDAVEDLLVELDRADLSRDAEELRAIQAARCIECQARHEKTYRP